MKNETKISHKRYYIYRHIIKSEDESIEYLTEDHWVWTKHFENSRLVWSEEFAAEIAKNYKLSLPDEPYTYCVGEVTVAVNNYFMGRVI